MKYSRHFTICRVNPVSKIHFDHLHPFSPTITFWDCIHCCTGLFYFFVLLATTPAVLRYAAFFAFVIDLIFLLLFILYCHDPFLSVFGQFLARWAGLPIQNILFQISHYNDHCSLHFVVCLLNTRLAHNKFRYCFVKSVLICHNPFRCSIRTSRNLWQ